jgi:alkylhydroperoxidase family enzyme
MARVPLVQDDDEAARATGIFDTFRDEGRDPPDIFRALANVPGLMTAHRALPQALRGRENCPPRLRELAVLRLAQLVGSGYEWSHHRPMALDAGVTSDQAAALAGWRESAVFGPAERLVLAAAEAVHEMAVTDELFGDLEAGLGRAGAMELIVVLSQYEAVARIIQALGVEVEASHRQPLVDWLFALDLFAPDPNTTYRDSAGPMKGSA